MNTSSLSQQVDPAKLDAAHLVPVVPPLFGSNANPETSLNDASGFAHHLVDAGDDVGVVQGQALDAQLVGLPSGLWIFSQRLLRN
jgi:hypothetical protein